MNELKLKQMDDD